MRPASFLLLLALFVASLVLAAVLGDDDGRLEGWELLARLDRIGKEQT